MLLEHMTYLVNSLHVPCNFEINIQLQFEPSNHKDTSYHPLKILIVAHSIARLLTWISFLAFVSPAFIRVPYSILLHDACLDCKNSEIEIHNSG